MVGCLVVLSIPTVTPQNHTNIHNPPEVLIGSLHHLHPVARLAQFLLQTAHILLVRLPASEAAADTTGATQTCRHGRYSSNRCRRMQAGSAQCQPHACWWLWPKPCPCSSQHQGCRGHGSWAVLYGILAAPGPKHKHNKAQHSYTYQPTPICTHILVQPRCPASPDAGQLPL